MKIAAYPQFAPTNAEPRGLAANYVIDFSVDANWTVPLNGSFQGDMVPVVSIFVDNTGNSSQVSYSVGAASGVIPQYASGYIAGSGAGAISFSCSNAAQMNVSLLNYKRAEGFNNPTFKPVSSSNTDPAGFSNVYGLWHFDGVNGQTTAADMANGYGMFNPLPGGTSLDTSQFLYGSTSLKCATSSASTSANSTNGKTLALTYTIEFSINVSKASGQGFLTIAGTWSIAVSPHDASTFVLNVGGNANLTSTPATYNAWHAFALSIVGGYCTLYTDGTVSQSFSGVTATNSNSVVTLSAVSQTSQLLWLDEFRITNNVARYNGAYTPATGPFPNS